MFISLKSDAASKAVKMYSVGQKDKEVIDAIFDKLHE